MDQQQHVIPSTNSPKDPMNNNGQPQAGQSAVALRNYESAFARAATRTSNDDAPLDAGNMFDLSDLTPADEAVQTGDVREKKRVRIYACGGTGVNLARRLETLLPNINTATIADFEIVYIDTSDANYVNGVAPENHYLVGEGKGSGKDLAANIDAAKAAASDILERFPPTDVSIFLGGLSGGSGAAIIPVLFGRAQRAGSKNIVIGVVSSASLREIKNTLTSLESLERAAANTGIPSVIAPFHNEKLGSEERANLAALSTVLMLGTLCSGLNPRIDVSDVANTIDYRPVSKAPAKLMALITDNEAGQVIKSNPHLTVITLATLSKDATGHQAPGVYDNQAAGFYPPGTEKTPTVHFMVVDGHVQKLYEDLAKDRNRFDAQAMTRAYSKPIGDVKGGNGDDDLVLGD